MVSAEFDAIQAFDLYELQTDVQKDPLLMKARTAFKADQAVGRNIVSVINVGLGVYNSVPSFRAELYNVNVIDCRAQQLSRAETDRASRTRKRVDQQEPEKENPYSALADGRTRGGRGGNGPRPSRGGVGRGRGAPRGGRDLSFRGF